MTASRTLGFLALAGWLAGGGTALPSVQSPPRPLWQSEEEAVQAIAFSPDGSLLAAAGTRIRLWKASDGTPVRTFDLSGTPNSIAFSPDGRLVAAGTFQDGFGVWTVADGKAVHTLTDESYYETHAVAFFPDGRTLAVGSASSGECTVGVWSLADGKRLRVLPPQSVSQGGGGAMTLSPDGKILALASPRVSLWDAAEGKLRLVLPEGAGAPFAFSPDGSRLGTGCSDGTIKLWQVKDGALVRTIKSEKDNGCAVALAFSADGRWIASTTTEERAFETVTLFGTAGGAGRVFDTRPAECVAISPDGKLIAWGIPGEGVAVARI